MVKIPGRLMRPDLKYIKLGNEHTDWCKRPVEQDYYTVNNYNCLDIQQFLGYHNYGIACGKLIVIDFDDIIFQRIMKDKLPETFIVRSAGKGLLHYYYLAAEEFKTMRVDIGKRRVCDILGVGNYVVGANSRNHGKEYEVLTDVPLTVITEQQIKDIFGSFVTPDKVVDYKKTTSTDRYNCWDILQRCKLNYKSVHKDGNFIRGIDPVYGITKGNKHNFFINDNGLGWFSFHSSEGGTPTELLSYIKQYSIDDSIDQMIKWRKEK